ncbi:MAG: glycosyltransferase family 4 protein [Rhodospirillales bacterium]
MQLGVERRVRALIFDPWCLVPYYTIALARGLIENGVDARIFSIGYDLDPECFRRAGLRNDPGLLDLFSGRRIGAGFLRRAAKLAQGAVNLAALAVRLAFQRPDIIHVQQLRLVQAGLPLETWFLEYARMLGCRLVYTVHNLLPHDTREGHRARYARLYRRMDALICHSSHARSRVTAEFDIDPTRVWVIPHGPLFEALAERRGSGGTGRECVVLWQGFVRPYKGLEFLLEAWKKLQPEPAARLVIAGSGEPEYLERLRARVEALGIAGSVELRFRFLDLAEMGRLYSLADIAVYPYREITTSGALLTGIGNGKAIVATDLPAFRELLRDGENALLVPYGDTQALANALRRLIVDPALRARLASRTLDLNDRLSWRDISAETRACYEGLLGHFGERSALTERGADRVYAQHRTSVRDSGDL